MSPAAVLHDVPANGLLAMFPAALVFAMFYANLRSARIKSLANAQAGLRFRLLTAGAQQGSDGIRTKTPERNR